MSANLPTGFFCINNPEAAEPQPGRNLSKARAPCKRSYDRLRQDWERAPGAPGSPCEAQRLREELIAERSKGFWQRFEVRIARPWPRPLASASMRSVGFMCRGLALRARLWS